MMNDFAPTGVSTYARLQHLQQTIAALQQNTLAKQSELFVFSDAPKVGDEKKVEAVRNYLHTIDGFKQVHIIERTENNRIANNRDNIRMLLERFGKIIFLEEDVVTAPGFLRFMNDALDFYKDDPRIFSICGCCMPVHVAKSYPHDVYILPRYGGWGDGYWADRFMFDKYIKEEDYRAFVYDRKLLKSFKARCGSDFIPMIEQEAKGMIDAGDVKTLFWQFKLGKYTVYPRKSLAVNVGLDSSGEHCSKTEKYDVELSNKLSFKLVSGIEEDHKIVTSNARFFSSDSSHSWKRLFSRASRAVRARLKGN
jgi:hypothetical protein